MAPQASAQSTTNLSLTFHNYNELLRESNGSVIIYNGADGAAATASTTKADLTSQITGTSMGYSYYSAVTMWTVPLPMDLHVKGTVSIRAYISSSYQLGGLFSGGGYSMGVVDVDENNREVKEFLSSPTYNLGNPFTSTPTQYSQSVSVDYTFSKGHTLAFVVGLGATAQGFTASVYFGSADRASGATLPIVPAVQTQSLQTDAGAVTVAADAAISNLQYDKNSHAITYNAKGIDYTPCSCTVSVPKALMQAPFTVTQGTKTLQATTSQNEDNTIITFSHTIDDSQLRVTGTASTTNTPTPNPSTQTPSPSSTPSSSSSTSTSPSSSVAPGTVQPTSGPSGSAYPSSSGQSSSSTDPHTVSPPVPEWSIYVLVVLLVVSAIALSVVFLRRKRLFI